MTIDKKVHCEKFYSGGLNSSYRILYFRQIILMIFWQKMFKIILLNIRRNKAKSQGIFFFNFRKLYVGKKINYNNLSNV